MPGQLTIVATPIGNLSDITLRALEALKSADAILCEDTRVTSKLLARYEIQKPLLTYQHHSSERQVELILERLRRGERLALATDSGTPGISDPGGKLVAAVREQLPEVKIEPIPGPSAVAAALSVSGLPADEFVFLGFIPHKKGRNKLFDEIAANERTVVFYESPHRIQKTMSQLVERCHPNRRIVVCRELTKMFETIYAGTIAEVSAKILSEEPRGEYVVVVARKTREKA